MKSVTLGEALRDVRTGPFGSLLHKSDYITGGIPLINPMHIADGRVVPDLEYSISSAKAVQLSGYMLMSGDIVLGRRGEMGRCAVVRDSDGPLLCGTGSMILSPDPEVIDADYAAHLIRTPKARQFLENQASGVTMLNLNPGAASKLPLPLPPLAEQKRIAAILDQADELRRKRQRAIDRLNQLGQAIFHEMFIEGAGDWPQRPLADVVNEGTIVTYGIVQAGDEYPGGVPYIRTGDIKEGEIVTSGLRHTAPEIAAKFDRSRVNAGEIVMSIRATVGMAAFVPPALDGANLTQGTARIAPGPQTDPWYLMEYIRSPSTQNWIEQQVKGATFREITLTRLRELMVVIPPKTLQSRFSDFMDQNCVQILLAKTALTECNLLFASLQHRAFRGEL